MKPWPSAWLTTQGSYLQIRREWGGLGSCYILSCEKPSKVKAGIWTYGLSNSLWWNWVGTAGFGCYDFRDCTGLGWTSLSRLGNS